MNQEPVLYWEVTNEPRFSWLRRDKIETRKISIAVHLFNAQHIILQHIAQRLMNKTFIIHVRSVSLHHPSTTFEKLIEIFFVQNLSTHLPSL
jgi:hypothetical protein